MVSITNTSRGCLSTENNVFRLYKQVSQIQKSIITGNKKEFNDSCEIILGSSYKVNYFQYSSFAHILSNTISLLDRANSDLSEMYDIVKQMQELYSTASGQNFSTDQLANLDTSFQNHINYLDQIATNASYFSLSLLNGDMAPSNPYNLSLPNNSGTIAITIPDMRNSSTPVANPGPDDPQIALPCTLAEFATAIYVPAGAAINVLSNIKDFCGQDSFLYIIANQINDAFNVGVQAEAAAVGSGIAACVAYLQGVNWYDLLAPNEALATENLMNDVTFLSNNAGSTIYDKLGLLIIGVVTQDLTLFETIDDALILAHIPPEFVTKASPLLSIALPDYFKVVGPRLEKAIAYIVNAQASINLQIQGLEGNSELYNNRADRNLDRANYYLKTDILQASSEISKLVETINNCVAIDMFKTTLKKIIFDVAETLTRNIQ